MSRDDILTELAQLDLVITRDIEEYFHATHVTPTQELAAVIARKQALRAEFTTGE